MTQSSKVWNATLDASGRVLVPAEIRRELNVTPGSSLIWVKTDQGLQLKSYEESLADIQRYYTSLAPSEDVWSDKLIERRRIEALRE